MTSSNPRSFTQFELYAWGRVYDNDRKWKFVGSKTSADLSFSSYLIFSSQQCTRKSCVNLVSCSTVENWLSMCWIKSLQSTLISSKSIVKRAMRKAGKYEQQICWIKHCETAVETSDFFRLIFPPSTQFRRPSSISFAFLSCPPDVSVSKSLNRQNYFPLKFIHFQTFYDIVQRIMNSQHKCYVFLEFREFTLKIKYHQNE